MWLGFLCIGRDCMRSVWICDWSVCFIFTFGFVVFVASTAWSLRHEPEHCAPFVNERHDCSYQVSLTVSIWTLVTCRMYSLPRSIASKSFEPLEHMCPEAQNLVVKPRDIASDPSETCKMSRCRLERCRTCLYRRDIPYVTLLASNSDSRKYQSCYRLGLIYHFTVRDSVNSQRVRVGSITSMVLMAKLTIMAYLFARCGPVG